MMTEHTDILINPETMDLDCVNGDFVTGESFDQEVEEILFTNTGDYKETPLLGPNLIRRLKGNINLLTLRRDVALSMEMDTKTLELLNIEQNKNLKVIVK